MNCRTRSAKERHTAALMWLTVFVCVTGLAALGASNMGFKITRQLHRPGPTSSGNNTVGLPYRPKPGMTTAKTLMDDIGSASVSSVSRYIESSGALETYTGRAGTPNQNFALVRSEAYWVKMITTVNYTPSHY